MNLTPIQSENSFYNQNQNNDFFLMQERQPTQPDDISLPSMQCGHAKVIASHDYKRLMFNWLYRTLKQTKQMYNNVSQEGISAFMMTYLLFI